MKEEYVQPEIFLTMFLPKEAIAGTENDPRSEHDNGYIDWDYWDADDQRRFKNKE